MQKSVLPSMPTGNRCLKNEKNQGIRSEDLIQLCYCESTRQRTESVTKRAEFRIALQFSA